MFETDDEKPYRGLIERARAEPFVRFLGVEIEAVGPGYVRCALNVQESMLDAAGRCHRGVLFSLADIAFSLGVDIEHRHSVALAMSANFHQGVELGQRLTAEARRVHADALRSSYVVELVASKGLLASFTGTACKC